MVSESTTTTKIHPHSNQPHPMNPTLQKDPGGPNNKGKTPPMVSCAPGTDVHARGLQSMLMRHLGNHTPPAQVALVKNSHWLVFVIVSYINLFSIQARKQTTKLYIVFPAQEERNMHKLVTG